MLGLAGHEGGVERPPQHVEEGNMHMRQISNAVKVMQQFVGY